LDLGLSKEEILEAMEIAIPEAGIVAFQTGIEPTVEVFEGGSGG
jgi:4-carboxymuconolactone decarboxylase